MILADFNIHLNFSGADTTKVIQSDLHMSEQDIIKSLETQETYFRNQFSVANFMLFNQFLKPFEIERVRTFLNKRWPASKLTLLANPRTLPTVEQVKIYKSAGVDAFKLHPYIQEINDDSYPTFLQLVQHIHETKTPLAIDASYGSKKIYEIDSLKFIRASLSIFTESNVVILHSGGAKILDAMLLALEYDNVFLDSSFSLPFYIGSSVETDMAFAYKKLGPTKIIYGSDHPYVSAHVSQETTLHFLQRHNFEADFGRGLFRSNFERFFGL